MAGHRFINDEEQGRNRFRWRTIYHIILYNENGVEDSLMQKILEFFQKEGRVKVVYIVEGGYKNFASKYPFRCVTSSVNPTDHEIYASHIIQNLYLGSEQNAGSKKQIIDLKISHVLNCARECQSKNFPIEFLNLALDDDITQDLTSSFDAALKFIDDCLKNGGSILVHCKMGKSRSASMVMAYLMRYQGFSFEQAHAAVKKARPNIDINDGFRKQLSNYHITLQQSNNRDEANK